MGQQTDAFVLTDDASEPESPAAASLSERKLRRCVGCVRCLTETPGKCAIKDGFPEISERIMGFETLEIHSAAYENGFSPMMTKAIERLSNELQAFTDMGGAIPLSKDSVKLRNIRVIMRGIPGNREEFELETLKNLRIGPVEEVYFEYR